MDNNYYKRTGRVSMLSVVTTLIGGLIGAGILASLYIALQWFIPFVYFNFLITLGLALGIITLVDFLHKNGKIRNAPVAIASMLIISLFTLYFQWALYVSLMMGAEENLLDGVWLKPSFSFEYFSIYFFHPSLLWADMLTLSSYGTFSIKGTQVSGELLWAVWAIEALMILGWPLVYMFSGQATKPFSEVQDSWMELRKLSAQFPFVEDKAPLVDQFIQGNFSFIENPLPADQHADRFSKVEVYELSGDPYQYICLENVTIKTNKKGETDTDSKAIIKHFKLAANSVS